MLSQTFEIPEHKKLVEQLQKATVNAQSELSNLENKLNFVRLPNPVMPEQAAPANRETSALESPFQEFISGQMREVDHLAARIRSLTESITL